MRHITQLSDKRHINRQSLYMILLEDLKSQLMFKLNIFVVQWDLKQTFSVVKFERLLVLGVVH